VTGLLCFVFALSLGFSCLWLIAVINYAITAARGDNPAEFHSIKVLVLNSVWITVLWSLTLYAAITTAWEFIRCAVR